MQLESLKTFCDLAETESFTKAAKINGVTQSAVSQQISSLEKYFKSLLIERSKKKFRLTREGQVLYDYSKEISLIYESLSSKLKEIKDIISGTIRVATIYSIGLHDLPFYLKKFLKAYPTVNVHVEYRRSHQVYEDVLSNVVDLGLVAYPAREPKLEVIPLRKEMLVLICHPQHPLAKFKAIKFKDVAGQKFVGFEPDMCNVTAEPAHWTKLEPQLASFLGGLPTAAVQPQPWRLDDGARSEGLTMPTKVNYVGKGADLYRPLAAIYKKNRALSPAMKQFLATLKG